MGGSSTLVCSILGVVSTPKSDAFICSIGFFLAFIIFGNDAYLGSFNLRSHVTIAGTFISIVSNPSCREVEMKFTEKEKKFDPEKVYKGQPNPTKI